MKKSSIATLLALSVLIGGCTQSFGGANPDDPTPVNLKTPDSADQEMIAAKYPIDPSLEEIVEIGANIDGTLIGTDYSCVIANKSWFLVNNLNMPTINDIDPKLFFVPEDSKKDWPKAGGTPDSPIRVDSALLPYRSRNNTGTESQWERIDGECYPNDINVSADAPQTFVDFLLSPEGQASIAKAGIAYPISEMVPEEVDALAPRPE